MECERDIGEGPPNELSAPVKRWDVSLQLYSKYNCNQVAYLKGGILKTKPLCPICGEPLEAAPKGGDYEDLRSALVESTRKGEAADLERSMIWHTIVHTRAWRGHYDSAKAMLVGELQGRGLRVPKSADLAHAYRVAREFGPTVTVGWEILYLALLYWAAIGKTDYDRKNPGGEIIRVPALGSFLEKALRECSEKELIDATRAAKPSPPKASDLSTAEVALQKVLQVGLTKLVGDDGRGSLQLKKPRGKLRVKLSLEMDVDRVGGLRSLLGRLG